MNEYYQKTLSWLLTSGLRILIILVITAVMMKLMSMVIGRVLAKRKAGKDMEFVKRVDTLESILRQAVAIFMLIVALAMILSELGVNIGAVIAAAGIVGVALGFGAQHIVRDVISGFFILMDDQVRIGDVVQIAGYAGLVEKINLRLIILRDLAGNVHYVRNGEITAVTNMTKEYSRYVFDIGVAYRENVDEVIEVIKQVDEELRNDQQFGPDILEPIEILGLDKFADSAVVIKARTKTTPIKQWAIGREFNRRLKNKFDELDIEIPFPHLTLYPGVDKNGTAPALNINSGK